MSALHHLYRHPLLSREEVEVICQAHQRISFRKGDFLLQPGAIANAYYCLEKGLVRTYVYDFNGTDITIGFAGNNELAIDVVSLFNRVPSVEYCQALTDCDCWVIDLATFQELYHSIKGFSEWGRGWMSASLFALKQRSIAMITDSASERYEQLQRERPQVLQQAPLKHIASYLGITDTSLSRIRKELVRGH